MPIYEYRAENPGCDYCRGGFDEMQRLSDAELNACPRCGAAVARVISAPSVISGQAHVGKESHIEKHGFSQYKRAGGGVYEKTAGKGPKFISGD